MFPHLSSVHNGISPLRAEAPLRDMQKILIAEEWGRENAIQVQIGTQMTTEQDATAWTWERSEVLLQTEGMSVLLCPIAIVVLPACNTGLCILCHLLLEEVGL